MKNTLWVFGDSFSEDTRCLPHDNTSGRMKYINEYLNGIHYKSWSYLLSEKLNMNYENRAASCGHEFTFMQKGNGNDSIFANISYNCDKFKKNDIVFIGLTDICRIPWTYDNSVFMIMPNMYPSTHSKEFFDEILIEKDNPFYYEQLIYNLDLVNCLAKNIGFKLIVWSWNGIPEDFSIKNNLKRDYFIYTLIKNFESSKIWNYMHEYGGTSISQETNDKIIDSHYSEKGEIAQSKIFLDLLNKFGYIN